MAYVVVRVKGKELHRLPLERGMTVGRSSACDVCVPEASLSREHCRLEQREGRWHVVDLESRNGVMVRKSRVPSAALGDGERVKLGVATLVFHAGPLRPARPADPIVDKVMRMAAAGVPANSDASPSDAPTANAVAARSLPRPRPLSRMPRVEPTPIELIALPQALPGHEEPATASRASEGSGSTLKMAEHLSRATFTATVRRWNGMRRSAAPVAAAVRQKMTLGWQKVRDEVAAVRKAA